MSGILIEELSFGKILNDQVKLYKLKNKNDFQLSLISYGASIQSIKLKDKSNKLTSVCLGFETIEGIYI
jgi:aldose 1-epimerase